MCAMLGAAQCYRTRLHVLTPEGDVRRINVLWKTAKKLREIWLSALPHINYFYNESKQVMSDVSFRFEAIISRAVSLV